MGKIKTIKWLWLAFAILTLPAYAQPFTPGVAPITTGTLALPTATQARTTLIAGIANKYIYLTAQHMIPGSGAVITWSTGTGTNCGTGNKVLDGPNTYGTASTPDNMGSGSGTFMVVPIGQDLCLTITTATISGSVAFGQF